MHLGGGHKIRPALLILGINGGKHFLFLEVFAIFRLKKSIYKYGGFNTTTSENSLFLEVGRYKLYAS